MSDDRLAIIGLAGRFPRAGSIDALWELLRAASEGRDGVTRFDDAELASAGVAPALLADPSYVKARACLDGTEYFDAAFFGMVAGDAARLDPQHRMFLECAWAALEHAGHGARGKRPRVGVFAAASASRYLHHLLETLEPAARDAFALDGTLADFLATRVAYALDLRGPALTVATACSSSLVALHLAGQSLLLGETDMAVVGGVSVAVPARTGVLWQEGSIVARNGTCRPFDARASGTVGGDAVVALVLRRFEDAVRDRDFIHAVVRGTAVNNDGSAKVGFTAPSVHGQRRVVRSALAVAGVAPGDVGYVEAHGSGTVIGDPIEVAALTEALAQAAPQSIALGSIKGSIGHTDAAAGLCGVVKAALCLRERTLVPMPAFREPDPRLELPRTPFRIPLAIEPWPSRPDGAPRIALVHSLGMGGTNAHAVLEEAPPRTATEAAQPWQLLVVSARTRPALERLTTELAEHLAAHPELSLADVAFTLAAGREPFAHRRCVVARTCADAAEALATRADHVATGVAARRSVAFVVPGLGEVVPGAAAGLYRHARAFRDAFDACAEIVERRIGVDIRTLVAGAAEAATNAAADASANAASRSAVGASGGPRTDPFRRWAARQGPSSIVPAIPATLAQPVAFALGWATHALWASAGVQAEVIAGYSLGEYVAAAIAGVFSIEDVMGLVIDRARWAEDVPAGAMTAIGMSADTLARRLPPGVHVAAVLAPELAVAGGDLAVMAAFERQLAADEVVHRRLAVTRAFHTPMMEPVAARIAEAVERLRRAAPTTNLYSNVTGLRHDTGSVTSARYWADHVVRPANLAAMIAGLASDGATAVVQLGSGTDVVPA